MKLIEKEIVIATDGKLPPDFREAFGRKARVAVYLQEQEQEKQKAPISCQTLSARFRPSVRLMIR